MSCRSYLQFCYPDWRGRCRPLSRSSEISASPLKNLLSSPATFPDPCSEGGIIAHETAALEGLERVKGIEPSYSAWKAAALPLSYTRAFLVHDLIGKPVPAFPDHARDDLTRPRAGLNRPLACGPKAPCSGECFGGVKPLTRAVQLAIL